VEAHGVLLAALQRSLAGFCTRPGASIVLRGSESMTYESFWSDGRRRLNSLESVRNSGAPDKKTRGRRQVG
jgi:hypothetical protein